MLSLKTIILKYLLVCVFLVSPWCVHRDRRPDHTVSVVPSPRFVLFVFSSVSLYPVFLSLMLAVRGSLRHCSRLSHPVVRGTSCPPFAGVYAAVRGSPIPRFAGVYAAVRGSPIPLFVGVLAAVRGSAIPPFAGVVAAIRGSAIPPRTVHPALSSQEMTPPATANPSPPACLWLNARRPASDSMPAGLPLTQCPPACLWFKPARVPLTQARRIAADSSSPDCRWLKLAGLPLTHATGRRWQGKPNHHICFTPPSAAHLCFTCFFYVGKANPPSAVTRPAAGWAFSSPPAPAVGWSSQPVMVSPAGLGRTDQTVTLGLFKLCYGVFLFVSPRRAPGTPELPHGFLGGGYKGPGCSGRA